ncbi:hypothetical protein GCM10010924_20950 [Rhizobium wenxiniae]|nr:hypothetical protein [Rhizobium wenxiniae]MBB6163191.1 hypothetical protein [Rhizobium wenxiniae]GGF92764.1 hypothetical protein GCM10010924_20950 [Rhizobium wenxiniae]
MKKITRSSANRSETWLSTLKTMAFQKIPDLVISEATEVMRQADKGKNSGLPRSALGEGAMNKIFEAVVRNGDQRVPVALVNLKQALEMSEKLVFEFSHPEHEAGKTDIFVGREVLQKLM